MGILVYWVPLRRVYRGTLLNKALKVEAFDLKFVSIDVSFLEQGTKIEAKKSFSLSMVTLY